jgi:hypothetical protein
MHQGYHLSPLFDSNPGKTTVLSNNPNEQQLRPLIVRRKPAATIYVTLQETFSCGILELRIAR